MSIYLRLLADKVYICQLSTYVWQNFILYSQNFIKQVITMAKRTQLQKTAHTRCVTSHSNSNGKKDSITKENASVSGDDKRE